MVLLELRRFAFAVQLGEFEPARVACGRADRCRPTAPSDCVRYRVLRDCGVESARCRPQVGIQIGWPRFTIEKPQRPCGYDCRCCEKADDVAGFHFPISLNHGDFSEFVKRA